MLRALTPPLPPPPHTHTPHPQLHLGTLRHACSLCLLSWFGPDGPNCNFLVNALNKLITKVNAIDTKIPSTSGLVTKTVWFRRNKVLRRGLTILKKRYPMLVADQKDWLQNKNFRINQENNHNFFDTPFYLQLAFKSHCFHSNI